MNYKVRYSMGLAFDSDIKHVVLLLKNKPDFLKGKWNAPGGKIEANETPLACCVREFWEETGVEIPQEKWTHLFTMANEYNSYTLDIFSAYSDDILNCHSTTDERVAVAPLQFLDMYHLAPNINWLIPFCEHRSLSFELPIKIKDLGGD